MRQLSHDTDNFEKTYYLENLNSFSKIVSNSTVFFMIFVTPLNRKFMKCYDLSCIGA